MAASRPVSFAHVHSVSGPTCLCLNQFQIVGEKLIKNPLAASHVCFQGGWKKNIVYRRVIKNLDIAHVQIAVVGPTIL